MSDAMTAPFSPSQTIGPFSHEAWRWACDAASGAAAGNDAITISGVICDGDGAPISDAMIEFWAPHAAYADSAQGNLLPGFRRIASDDKGGFSMTMPRAAARAGGEPAALVTVFARGLVLHQFSAVFLEDDPALPSSAMLDQVPAARRPTLIARKTGPAAYAWDIRMQGDKETVFFDYAGAP
jgi:protocatechuate 3,4-dioxygenase alpha subunit